MKTSSNRKETEQTSASVNTKQTETTSAQPGPAETFAGRKLDPDQNRPGAVEKRRQKTRRTARANIEDLCDTGSFIEYGTLADTDSYLELRPKFGSGMITGSIRPKPGSGSCRT